MLESTLACTLMYIIFVLLFVCPTSPQSQKTKRTYASPIASINYFPEVEDDGDRQETKPSPQELKALKTSELRKLASKANLPLYSRKSKADLIYALEQLPALAT